MPQTPLGRPALLLALLICMLSTSPAAAIDNNCYYTVVQVATITTYGEIRNTDGTISYVPMGGVTYVYYGVVCDSDGTYSDDTGGGLSTTYTPLKPKVSFRSINTTDPYAPTLMVDVVSDPVSPANRLTVTVNSSTIHDLPMAGDGAYVIGFRPIDDYRAGTYTITARACTGAGSCGTTSKTMYRSSASALSATERIAAWYISGDDWINATYGHEFVQGYMTTWFTIPEMAQNSRRQLRNGLIKLQTDYARSQAAFNGRFTMRGTLYKSYFGAQFACSYVPTCYGYCTHRCGDSRLFGFDVTVQDEVKDLILTDNFTRVNLSYGGSLQHHLP